MAVKAVKRSKPAPESQSNVLAASHLRKVYRGRAVVDDVSISVGRAEIVGLLGPNGAGKTTTFYMVVGLTPPDRGEVVLGDVDITDLPMYLRAQRGISYLPQRRRSSARCRWKATSWRSSRPWL